jgi:glycosyltransferase involved in cell wall biosynthesis
LIDGRTLLVYRDRIVPRSEAGFLRRQYVGFRYLVPVWIGRRTDAGLADLEADPVLIGRRGVAGTVDRMIFKQFGRIPPGLDLPKLRPRLIHAHFGRGGALALPIARTLRLPLVVTFHGGDATKEQHYRQQLVPTVFQRRCAALQREAALVICPSEHIREVLLERGFPASKVTVIRYGIEIEADCQPAAPPARPYLLFVGRFVEKKGVVHLLDAMRILESEGTAIDLVLIGDGPLAEGLRRRAAVQRQVRFLGWRPSHEVRQAMRGAAAVCVPSVEAKDGDADGLPNVVLEAMAVAAPVVGSDLGGIAETVQDQETGFLVPPGDASAIAAAVRRLVGDSALRNRMGQAARAAATARFDAIVQSRILEDALLAVSAAPSA